jgi:uncharacterized protein YfaS (alpha-2-macroglobulin family)
LVLRFSEALGPVSLEEVKRMVRFEPAFRDIAAEVSGEYLRISFKADRSTPYRVRILPVPIRSARGRTLGNTGEASFWFYLTQLSPFISWKEGQAIVERFGPQVFPMEGRGIERIDLRIYRIDPLDLRFWPFPSSPVSVNEQRIPPMPGEEDQAGTLDRRIRLLGSPDFSEVVQLPVSARGNQSRFGIDLAPYLQKISGSATEPGTYLVGYRLLDGSENRFYVRLQVTDLSLSTVEEEHGILFLVTSLSTGNPVTGAGSPSRGPFPERQGTSPS